MRFHFEQRWIAQRSRVVELYVDEAFWSGIDDFSATTAPEVLSIERQNSRAVVRLHYRLAVDLPGEAARFIDTGNVAWTEESTWDLAQGSAAVRFLPDQASRLIRASAVTQMRQIGDETVREISGELKVSIPLLGSRVERAIVEGVGRHLEEETAALRSELE